MLVDETLEMARLPPKTKVAGFPRKRPIRARCQIFDLADPAWDDLTPEQRIGLARQAEAAAFDMDPAITNSDGASFEFERSRTALANSLGFDGRLRSPPAATSLHLPLRNPTARNIGAIGFRLRVIVINWLLLKRSGGAAAQRALQCLGARKVKTCQVPVVFDPDYSSNDCEACLRCGPGDAIYRKRSFLGGKLGESVAEPESDDCRRCTAHWWPGFKPFR